MPVLPQNDFSGGQRCGHIDQSLVFRPPESQGQILFLLHKGPVHQHIQAAQELPGHCPVPKGVGCDLFKKVAGESPNAFVRVCLLLLPQQLHNRPLILRLKKEASEYSEDRKQLEQELFGARDFAKSYSLHGFFVSRLEKRFRAFLQKTGQAQCRVDALAEALDFLSGQGSRLCVVLVGTFQAARGRMELGMLLAGFLILPSLTRCFAYVRGWITEKHDEAKYLDRISVFYGEFEDGEGIAPALTSLDAKNVRFSYSENGKNVLSGVDFHMTSMENVRLAGPNGSGKTTLLSILAGLYEPSSGIVCGGASVGQRRKSTALQEQSGAIFSGTVWENLFLGEDKRPAAEALLEEMGFGKTLEYTVEPGGGNLSPGERKKILLTRAFLRDAPFLLLDEPMNHLDAQAAEVVKEKLRQRQGGILLISHREDICEGLGMGELLMKRKS